MKTRRATWLAIAAAAVLCVLGAAPTAAAAPPNPGVVVEDGVTQPVFGYLDAIRERVLVQSTSTATPTASTTPSPWTSSGRPPRPRCP